MPISKNDYIQRWLSMRESRGGGRHNQYHRVYMKHPASGETAWGTILETNYEDKVVRVELDGVIGGYVSEDGVDPNQRAWAIIPINEVTVTGDTRPPDTLWFSDDTQQRLKAMEDRAHKRAFEADHRSRGGDDYARSGFYIEREYISEDLRAQQRDLLRQVRSYDGERRAYPSDYGVGGHTNSDGVGTLNLDAWNDMTHNLRDGGQTRYSEWVNRYQQSPNSVWQVIPASERPLMAPDAPRRIIFNPPSATYLDMDAGIRYTQEYLERTPDAPISRDEMRQAREAAAPPTVPMRRRITGTLW